MGKGPKPLKELNLTSRFLFDEVMEDTETLRNALCIILEREIPLLSYSETEKELRVSPLLRSIRLDVITMDEESVVSEELVEFLHYVEETTDGVAEEVESTRIKRIHERVCKVKTSEKVGVKYMQAWEEKYYEREEGRKEGIEEGIEKGVALTKKVLKMDAENVPVEIIAKECNVSMEQVKEILK